MATLYTQMQGTHLIFNLNDWVALIAFGAGDCILLDLVFFLKLSAGHVKIVLEFCSSVFDSAFYLGL